MAKREASACEVSAICGISLVNTRTVFEAYRFSVRGIAIEGGTLALPPSRVLAVVQ